MSKPLNVLVSGGGIAGSVFAFWLLEAFPDANITIVERAPALRLTGASVDIRSSAVDIIKRMGVEPEIRRHSTKEEGVQWVRADGSPIGTIRATGRTDMQTITSEYEIHRGELAKVFFEPILDKVNLVLNESVETYDDHGDRVDVTFVSSEETKTYDLLVAADGYGSRIRGLLLNAKPRDHFHDEGMHCCYWTASEDLLEGSKLAKWHNDVGGRVVFLRPDPHPDGRTRGMFINVTTPGMTELKDKLNRAVGEGNASYQKLMQEQMSDLGWLAPKALQTMLESDDFYCSVFGQIRSPKLQSGRVVLLGDAGYATPGFGTSLAIMGGYVLAGELLSQPDVRAAMVAYENLMQPFVKSQQGNDNAMQLMNPQTRWGLRIRDFLLGLVTGLKLDQIAISVAAWLGFTEALLKMPDYSWPSRAT